MFHLDRISICQGYFLADNSIGYQLARGVDQRENMRDQITQVQAVTVDVKSYSCSGCTYE